MIIRERFCEKVFSFFPSFKRKVKVCSVNKIYVLKRLYEEATTLQKVSKRSITCSFIFWLGGQLKKLFFFLREKVFGHYFAF